MRYPFVSKAGETLFTEYDLCLHEIDLNGNACFTELKLRVYSMSISRIVIMDHSYTYHGSLVF